ncbi:hypothetical protein, partial [Aquimarina litoralis]|uniref:hypothetical protein n=1 Tax=Aquimarina litoralis TaxID=584605 RepID=UPI001C57C0DD
MKYLSLILLFTTIITNQKSIAQTTTSLGQGAGTLGNENTSIGYQAGSKSTGFGNVFLGAKSGQNTTNGAYNVLLGPSS